MRRNFYWELSGPCISPNNHPHHSSRGSFAPFLVVVVMEGIIASELTLAHLPSTETDTVENWLQFVALAFHGEAVSSSTVSIYDDFDLKSHKEDTTVEPGDIFHQRWRRDPASAPGVAFLALVDSNRIVASVRYFPRQIYINVRSFRKECFSSFLFG
jgi:hypothetical protein